MLGVLAGTIIGKIYGFIYKSYLMSKKSLLWKFIFIGTVLLVAFVTFNFLFKWFIPLCAVLWAILGPIIQVIFGIIGLFIRSLFGL